MHRTTEIADRLYNRLIDNFFAFHHHENGFGLFVHTCHRHRDTTAAILVCYGTGKIHGIGLMWLKDIEYYALYR